MSRKPIDRTGEVRKMNNGLMARIVAYKNAHDVDVEFSNNGHIVKTEYAHFKRGEVKCPMIFSELSYGTILVNNPNIGIEFIVDIGDIDIVKRYRFWHKDHYGYIITTPYRHKTIKLHKIIVQTQDECQIDHINGNRADNRRSNLRVCTAQQNSRNRATSSKNKSGYKGVVRNSKSKNWGAYIKTDNVQIYLGTYDNKTDAARAYNEAAIKYHGEFARLNAIPEAA